jgi:glycosyltransferase involved in cell wall biosynthesis
MRMARASPHDMRVALVIWSGVLGGAETWSIAMARQLNAVGVRATVIAITSASPVSDQARELGVPIEALGLSRGRDLALHMRRYASLVGELGPDGAIVMTSGYMATALRVGGYARPVVGVEHGQLLQGLPAKGARRWCALTDLRAGARSLTSQVAVSPFTLAQLRQVPHHPTARVIRNGIDVERFSPTRKVMERMDAPTIGWAGRMIEGKGVDVLIHAHAALPRSRGVRLVLAGDGPERARLQGLADQLQTSRLVKFIGSQVDMPRFWNGCDIGVASSDTFIESFGIAPAEAGACGRPVVATRNGGFPDVVEDGITGRVVSPAMPTAMAAAVSEYLSDPVLARADGARGRARVQELFDIRRCAEAYLALLSSLPRVK